MDDRAAVIDAAEARAEALARGDADELLALLHDAFRWTTHTGQVFDRAEYVARNTGGTTVWRSQTLVAPSVVVVGDTAVLMQRWLTWCWLLTGIPRPSGCR